jgi:hypothetical protein
MKAGSSVMIIVLSMHSAHGEYVQLDPAYQRMVEQQFNPNETNGVTLDNNVPEDAGFGKDVEESRPAPNLIGWEWLTG